MNSALKNIIKLQVIDARHLQWSNYLHTQRVVLFNVVNFFTNIPLIGHAQMSVTDKLDNNVRMFDIKINATTCDLIDLPIRPAFLITTLEGEELLIGSHEQPFPTTSNNSIYSSSPSTRSVNTLTISYYGPNPPFRTIK